MEPRLKLASNSELIVHATPLHCTQCMLWENKRCHITDNVSFHHFSLPAPIRNALPLPLTPPAPLSSMFHLL